MGGDTIRDDEFEARSRASSVDSEIFDWWNLGKFDNQPYGEDSAEKTAAKGPEIAVYGDKKGETRIGPYQEPSVPARSVMFLPTMHAIVSGPSGGSALAALFATLIIKLFDMILRAMPHARRRPRALTAPARMRSANNGSSVAASPRSKAKSMPARTRKPSIFSGAPPKILQDVFNPGATTGAA